MVLKPATNPHADDQPPDIPGNIPRHGAHDTPWIRRPGLDYDPRDDDVRTRRPKSGGYYTRASKLGDPIPDKFKIQQAREGRIVFGLSRARHLVDMASAVEGVDSKEDKAALKSIAAQAYTFGGGDAASSRGTAFHNLSEQRDQGKNLNHLRPELLAGLDAWERVTARFAWVATEVFVVNDELKAAGTFDRLAELREPIVIVNRKGQVVDRLQPGERVIADLKSGQWGPKWFGPSYGVQALVYATGTPYTHREGRLDWPQATDGEYVLPPSTRWAVIPWVSPDNPDSAGLHWIDLDVARQFAGVVELIRWARKADGLFIEDVPWHEPIPADVTELPLVKMLANAECEDDLTRLWESHKSRWSDECTEAAQRRLAELKGQTA